jgi:hypothetical protein
MLINYRDIALYKNEEYNNWTDIFEEDYSYLEP